MPSGPGARDPDWGDDWEIDETLESAKRALRRSAHLAQRYHRVDAAHNGIPGNGPTPPKQKRTPRPSGGNSARRLFAWAALCCGALGLSFGLVILGLAAFGQRGDLTALGIGAAMLGQVCLMAGTLAWIDRRASSAGRETAEESNPPRFIEQRSARPPWTPGSDEVLLRTMELFPQSSGPRRKNRDPSQDQRRSA